MKELNNGKEFYSNMLLNLTLAALLMITTTVIHAVSMILSIRILKSHHGGKLKQQLQSTRIYWVIGIILLMFLAMVLEAVVWASTYILIGALEHFEQALYFSMVTFTTLGYGDVTLENQWRVLGSFEAANGIIMFGWTTAIVFFAVQRIYFEKIQPN